MWQKHAEQSRGNAKKKKGEGEGVVWLPGPAADGLQDKKFCGPHHEPQCA